MKKMLLLSLIVLSTPAFSSFELSCSKKIGRCDKDHYPYSPFRFFKINVSDDGQAQVKGLNRPGVASVELNERGAISYLSYTHGENASPTVVVSLDEEDGFYYGQSADSKEGLTCNGFSQYNYCQIRCRIQNL